MKLIPIDRCAPLSTGKIQLGLCCVSWDIYVYVDMMHHGDA